MVNAYKIIVRIEHFGDVERLGEIRNTQYSETEIIVKDAKEAGVKIKKMVSDFEELK